MMDLDAVPNSANDDDKQESLVDKLRGGNFDQLVDTATKTHEAQQKSLCLQADGSVVKGNPYSTVGRAPPPPKPTEEEERDKEFEQLRKARLEEMRKQQQYKQQGHGDLKLLHNELQFAQFVVPHERGVCLLDDGNSAQGDQVCETLGKLAKVHMEALFCRVPADKAQVILNFVKLEGLPTIFITNRGEVVHSIPPAKLFQRCSASSPMFTKNLVRLLHNCGALTNDEGGTSSEEEDDDQPRNRGGKLFAR